MGVRFELQEIVVNVYSPVRWIVNEISLTNYKSNYFSTREEAEEHIRKRTKELKKQAFEKEFLDYLDLEDSDES